MLNTILATSMLRRMRLRRTLAILGCCELALLALVLGGMADFLWMDQVLRPALAQGQRAYMMAIGFQLGLTALVCPVLTAGSIAGERERKTLELLLVTRVSAVGIVFGKLMENFAFLALLIVCGLPVTCLTMLVGGVTLAQILTGTLFVLCCAFAAACVGVFASTLMKNTVAAAIVSYVLLLVIGGATILPLVYGISPELRKVLMDDASYAAMTPMDGLRVLPKVLLLNPAVGLAAMLEMQTGRIVAPYVEGGGRLPALFQMMKKIGYGNVLWINMVLMALLALALALAGAAFVRPGRLQRRAGHGTGD